MKTVITSYLLSFDIKEVIEMVVSSVEKKGFVILKPISNQTFTEMLAFGELEIEAKKSDVPIEEKEILFSIEKDEIVLSPEEKEVIFSDLFLSRAGAGAFGLGMFINNVSRDQILKSAGKAFNKLSDNDKKLLTFVFSLNNKNDESNKTRSTAEIKNKFNLSQPPQHLVRKTVRLFAEIMRALLVNSLNESGLILKLAMERRYLLERSIESIGFSVKTFNCFRSHDYKKVADIISPEEKELKKMRSFGSGAFQEVEYFKKLYHL